MQKLKMLDIASKLSKFEDEQELFKKWINEIKEDQMNELEASSPVKSINKLESFRTSSPVKQGYESPRTNVSKPFAYIDQIKRDIQDELHSYENKVDNEIDGISKSLNKGLLDLKVSILF